MKWLSFAALAFLLGASEALAQQPLQLPQIDSGSIVRLHFLDSTQVAARLIEPIDRGSSVIRYCPYRSPTCGLSGGPVPADTPITALAQVDARSGNRAARGALIGAAVGAAILAAIAVGSPDAIDVDNPAGILVGVPLLLAVPAGIGALIGSGSSVWKPLE